MLLFTESAQQTKHFGYRLGKNLPANAHMALSGELGAGKTCLTQGIISGMGGDEKQVTSPSYTLINQYKTPRGIVFHCDLYRLNTKEQIFELGLEEYLEKGTVVIEWPEAVLEYLSKAGFLHVKMIGLEEHKRQIELVPYGVKYQTLAEIVSSRLG